MLDYLISLILFAIILLLMYALFYIPNKIKEKKVIKHFKINNLIAESVITYTKLNNDKEFKEYPAINKYLNRNVYIREKGIIDIDKVQVKPIDSDNPKERSFLDKLMEEFDKAPPIIKDLLVKQIDIAFNIVEYKHFTMHVLISKLASKKVIRVLIPVLEFAEKMLKRFKAINEEQEELEEIMQETNDTDRCNQIGITVQPQAA